MEGPSPSTAVIIDGIKWLESDRQRFSVSGEGDQYWVDAEVALRVPAKGRPDAKTVNVLEFGVSYTYNAAGQCEEAVLSYGITPTTANNPEGTRTGDSIISENGRLDESFLETLSDGQLDQAARVIRAIRAHLEASSG